jgi:cell division protein FtsI (penicillin-binding protein 3)
MNPIDTPYMQPRRPVSLEPQPDPASLIVLDGTINQCLEVGRTRLLVAGLVFTMAFLVVGLRLVGLSLLTDGREPRVVETHRATAFESVRADIVDRNGIVLATTLPTASLYANPRQILDPAATARRLAAALPEIPEHALAAKLAGDSGFVWLKRKLTPRQQHEVNSLGIPGLYFQREPDRIYPHGPLAAHVVGFAGVDNRGLAGIEQAFEQRLRGSARPLELSLDLRVQHILSAELASAMVAFQAVGATGLVLDAETGEIAAMVSLPSFEPANPGNADSDALFNRASLGVYEMGSVFKIFTTAMALDQGAVSLQDGFDVSRPIRVARFTISDFKPKNRWLSVPEIFIYSSNIGSVHMAMEAGTTRQKVFLHNLGLTRAPEIELPEVGQPMIPAPWREINTMTISYGHGLAVSPLQLVSAVAAVVNGGDLVPATLLKRGAGERVVVRRVLSPKTSRDMRWLMRLAVQKGTGRLANAPGYLVGGKTGTADKLRGRRYATDARFASFIGAFPMDQPRYLVFAMLDEPKGNETTHGYATGGWVAAPVVRRVIERMGPLLGIRSRGGEEEAGADRHLIPVSLKGTVFAAN